MTQRSTARPVRSTGLALAAAVLTVALATACEPDSPAPAAPTAPNAAPPAGTSGTGSTGGAAGAAGNAAGQAKTVQINKTAYWGGLRYDVKTAAYTPTGGGSYKVTLETTVTNTFKTYAVRDWPTFAIDSAGHQLTAYPNSNVPPTPTSSNPLTLTFEGAGKPFSFDGASFVLGDPGVAQAVVPLGTGGREAVSLKPIDLTVAPGTALNSGRLTLTIKAAVLHADFGDGNGVTTLKRGQRALLVTYDMTGHVGPAGMAVAGDVLRLKLPNGQEVGPTRAPIEALYPDRPTRQDQAAWFVFDGATDGTYTFSVTDPPAAPAPLALTATGVKDSGPLA